jgi:hypothetical protein
MGDLDASVSRQSKVVRGHTLTPAEQKQMARVVGLAARPQVLEILRSGVPAEEKRNAIKNVFRNERRKYGLEKWND